MIREGDILICNEDFNVMGTGITWSFVKGRKYKVIKCYTMWKGYSIQCIRVKGKYPEFRISCAMSEWELMEKFDYLYVQRKNKIEKIKKRINDNK